MKVKFIFIGKTDQEWVREGLAQYTQRLKRYISYENIEIPSYSGKIQDQDKMLLAESEKIMAVLKPADYLVLLDDKGEMFSSEQMAAWLNRKFTTVNGDIIFVCGSAYGFHNQVRKRAQEQISLSRLTFTHQMVRVIFAEQLYRALTILKNEPYHHS